jgi:hypothetical protein
MSKKIRSLPIFFSFILFAVGCGGRQGPPVQIETRPLEEGKAFPIIEEVLAERGYSFEKEVSVIVDRGTEFDVDYKVKGEKIAIEYLTKTDRQELGELPPPGEGSRLHVVTGRVTGEGGVPSRVFVLFVDDRNFIYHANPTSEVRADVTFLEVDSRLRRDISDFLGWYEDSGKR